MNRSDDSGSSKRYALALLLGSVATLISTATIAGDAENIQSCVKKAYEFSGISLDEFKVSYQGNILAMSVARWSNTYCEVKLGDVYALTVNGKELIYRGYAGRDSYELKNNLDAKTEEAIRQLKSRISLLEQRVSQAGTSLKMPRPDHVWLTRYVDEGIEKATGVIPPSTQLSVPTEVPQVSFERPAIKAATTNQVPPMEIPIPRSADGDKGKYFLLEREKHGDIVRALHKRVGVDSVGYTLTETNCSSMQMRELGYSEQSPSAIRVEPTKWFSLVTGSSKSDLANFVCR